MPHLPVIVDIESLVGHNTVVQGAANAAIAAGADGLIFENRKLEDPVRVRDDDVEEAISFTQLRQFAGVVNREIKAITRI